jgi:hypothetical protein
MLKSPHLQPAISARDSHFEESTKLEALNEDLAAAETAAAMAPAASQHTFPPAALDAQLHSIPSRIMNEDNADLSIDDVPFASSSAREHLAASISCNTFFSFFFFRSIALLARSRCVASSFESPTR